MFYYLTFLFFRLIEKNLGNHLVILINALDILCPNIFFFSVVDINRLFVSTRNYCWLTETDLDIDELAFLCLPNLMVSLCRNFINQNKSISKFAVRIYLFTIKSKLYILPM